MAAITCSYSGVVFNCEHMPLALSSREYHHPLFSISKKKLLGLSGQWSTGKLSPTESYLLYLSLLHSTELIDWRVPAAFHSKTMQIISNNMESLIHIIGKIDLIHHPSFALPRFAITSDTCNLSNSYHWIQTWIENYNDWIDGYKHSNAETRRALENRESALQRLIKSSHTDQSELASILSKWAALAGDFPQFITTHPLTKKRVPICDYWEQIIRSAANEDKIWQFPRGDIAELIDHCEDNIIHGSIYAHSLMKLLRDALRKYDDYLGFGDIDLAGRTTSFTIMPPTGRPEVSESTTAETANILSILSIAPESEPKRHQYPTNFAFIRAKANYDLAQAIARKKATS